MSFTICFLPRACTRSSASSTARFTAPVVTRPTTHIRPGRLLVECLVAMLLLDASALVVVSLARGASASTQAASGTTTALSIALRGVETSIATPCPSGNASGHDALPAASVAWTERTHGRWRERDVEASLTNSALVGPHTNSLRWRAARLCQ